MPVSVTMPRLGESVSEGTVTRWLKKEGDRVEADEPLLEVSTDKVDTEIPAPASGVLTSIKVAEDETVDVGTELAVIGDEADLSQQPVTQPGGTAAETAPEAPPQEAPEPAAAAQAPAPPAYSAPTYAPPSFGAPAPQAPAYPTTYAPSPATFPAPSYASPAASAETTRAGDSRVDDDVTDAPASLPPNEEVAQREDLTATEQAERARQQLRAPSGAENHRDADAEANGAAYVTPLVRRLASEHGVDLAHLQGTGVGGRIRKQDVIAASATGTTATATAAATAPAPQPTAQQAPAAAPVVSAPAATAPAAAAPATAAPAASKPSASAAALRGRTEQLTRRRKVIAQRMVESLQTAAQLTTVVEVDVTKVARLRQAAKGDFEAREGVKLTFMPFFALAAIEALKEFPVVNSSLDMAAGTVTYHDGVHLGIAVDTEQGLVVPVIQNAGDLNVAGLARKIADVAARTRGNQVSPDELSGGTFTLTNTGSRGALFDTPIINQPQSAILGTGAVVKRPAVVDDAENGETIAIRSMVYFALSYDHRIVDGADAARFLSAVKQRLEEGRFASELGL
jgi:pyruvate dehydrogenase E2 component (dihydrolipoamide acetyltransferase)